MKTIEENTEKMQDLREKQDECQTQLYSLKCSVHDNTMTVEGLRIERNMRVNLDDQHEINKLMIMIEDNDRRSQGSNEMADRAIADW